MGTESGLLMVFPLNQPAARQILREEDFTVNSRVWKIVWAHEDAIVLGSTYGELSLYVRRQGKWDRSRLEGHSDSIFGIGTTDDGSFIASGDYKGNIIIWRRSNDVYEKVEELKVQGSIEAISWRGDGAFAAVSRSGHIYFFEPEQTAPTSNWQLVLETDTATGIGKCIHLSRDSKVMLAGTFADLIQVDLDSQHIQQKPLDRVCGIFSQANELFVLSASGLAIFDRRTVQPPLSLVKYQFGKVSLVGHTGTGKSTLCSLVVRGPSDDIKSTFGRRVWDWRLEAEHGSLERRIMLHDLGGQETVLSTLLPFIADSDVILLFFKQNDVSTFRRALSSIDQLTPIISSRTRMLLVETHIDQPINEVDESFIRNLIKEEKIRAWLRVCPTTGEGADKLKESLVSEIAWQNARVVMRSEYVEGVTRTISQFEDKRAGVVGFQDFKKQYEQLTSHKISSDHLQFLLSGFASQGMIEYYPEILDKIIFNDETCNRLKTNIPILVEKRHGVISIREIRETFANHEYLPIIDQVYLNYGIAIKNHDLRIFPSRLRIGPAIDPPQEYKALLTEPFLTNERQYRPSRVDISRIIAALGELGLSCLDVTQRDGLFTWEKNACVYYTIQESGDAFSDRMTKVAFRIGGTKEAACRRLEVDFTNAIDQLYGPALIDPSVPKKK